jgi:hypothetical protein
VSRHLSWLLDGSVADMIDCVYLGGYPGCQGARGGGYPVSSELRPRARWNWLTMAAAT